MFYDRAKINVKAGDGGNGIVAFRREKFVPDGGPAGGDGGRGGSIYLVADHNLHTLLDFKMKQHYKAERGSNGMNSNKTGAAGNDTYLRVPIGTIVRVDGEDAIIADLVTDGQTVVIAKGGIGGKGNKHFSSNRDKAPRIAENGAPGEEMWIRLELKVLADVGLIGMPNAGKSTLISMVSAAKPKIADYPFTTLTPNLGIVSLDEGQSFCMADVPGLIENAHLGEGLGHYFLRHIERTKVLIHVVDMGGTEGRDPLEDFRIVNEELIKFKPEMANRPMIVAANKMDMPDAEENLARFKEKYGDQYEIFPVMTLIGENLKPLIYKAYELLQSIPVEEPVVEEEIKVTTIDKREPFKITRDAHGYLWVQGEEIHKWMIMTDFQNEDTVRRFQRILKVMGVDNALKAAGACAGDTIIIDDMEFEYQP